MAQARRKSPTRKGPSRGTSFHGLGMLVTGIVIGALGTILWQGTQVADGGVGTGIRKMIEQSREAETEMSATEKVGSVEIPVKQETSFDFYTVLPEIEVIVPEQTPEKKEASDKNASQDADSTSQDENSSQETSSAYMLQAGSYQRKSDADKLKAELALMGHGSTIQKVTIQDRGDFFRVRLGPYTNHDEMVKVDSVLASQGIKALRLKISRGG